MPNGEGWYGGRLPGWDWWRREWEQEALERRKYLRYVPPRQYVDPYAGSARFPPARARAEWGPGWGAREEGPEWGARLGPQATGPTGAPQPIPWNEARAAWQEQQPMPYGVGIPPWNEARRAWQEQQGITYAPTQTPVEQALADVARLAATPQPTPQPEYQYQWPGERGYWAATGQQPGNYPVPLGIQQQMQYERVPWRRDWEEWSWRTRGIPLQGYELARLGGGFPPWGRPEREGRYVIGPIRRARLEAGAPWEWSAREGRNIVGRVPEETPGWEPGAWSQTF